MRRIQTLLAVAGGLALVAAASASAQEVSPKLVQLNQKLAAQGAAVRIEMAEYITSGTGSEIGRTLYASNRGNKQLGSHWVPGDPNRDGRTDITWINDTLDGDANGAPATADTQAAIERAMNTWEDVTCSVIPLTYLGSYNFDLGYVERLVYGPGQGYPGWFADLTHAGWLPRTFFDAIAPPNGGNNILGVTFTFIWVDTATGEPTDMDGNGKTDVAFREIYYNNRFTWKIDGNYDVETIALHESGHGLSQAHFGDIFRTTSNGKLHFSPRAVMNAAYSGVQQVQTGTDNAGHCSIWASWPMN